MTLPTDPYNFTNGATADAEQVDARFLALFTALAAGGLDAEALASQAWTAWTPTITTIVGASNTVVARSMKLGRTVHAQGEITFGSGGSLTGTDVTISLPYTAANTLDQVGQAYGFQSGSNYGEGAVYVTKNTATLRARLSGPVILTEGTVSQATRPLAATWPWTWASGDVLRFAITYEAAS